MVPGTARWIGETRSIRGIKLPMLFGPGISAWWSSIECRGDLVTNWGGGDDVLVLCYSNGFVDHEI